MSVNTGANHQGVQRSGRHKNLVVGVFNGWTPRNLTSAKSTPGAAL